METDAIDSRIYDVVMNDEEQYSVWPHGTPVPAGWRSTGFSGDETTCLAHIDEVWTDLRPRGLREWLATRS